MLKGGTLRSMSSFISEIKKIPTDKLIYAFSQLSIQMYKDKMAYTKSLPLQINRGGFYQTKSVLLTAWDIPNIEYLAITNSTDYRSSNKTSTIPQLVNLYRGFEDELSSKQIVQNSNSDEVFRIILGMSSEQFQFQKPHLIFEKLNRTYHILVAASNYEHRQELDVNAAVRDTFDFSAEDYLAVLLMVFWLCTQHPNPLTAPEELYKKKDNTVFTKENIDKFVKYYSCTYDQLRKSKIQKQLLYSKPFIQTQRYKKYLSSSVYMVAFLLANGLYWLVRDYYKNDCQKFPNAFGLLFEDYIKELATTYCEFNEWEVIEKNGKKVADYVFVFDKLQLVVESKSSLLKLDAKQQIPNLLSADDFFERIIEESYEQVNNSYEEYKDRVNTPTIKIILLYDEFSNTAIIEQSMLKIFDNDPNCFVMTIRQFEILLYLHKNDTEKFDMVINKIIEFIDTKKELINFDAIFDKADIYENPHFDGNLDYLKPILQHFADNFYYNNKEKMNEDGK